VRIDANADFFWCKRFVHPMQKPLSSSPSTFRLTLSGKRGMGFSIFLVQHRWAHGLPDPFSGALLPSCPAELSNTSPALRIFTSDIKDHEYERGPRPCYIQSRPHAKTFALREGSCRKICGPRVA